MSVKPYSIFIKSNSGAIVDSDAALTTTVNNKGSKMEGVKKWIVIALTVATVINCLLMILFGVTFSYLHTRSFANSGFSATSSLSGSLEPSGLQGTNGINKLASYKQHGSC